MAAVISGINNLPVSTTCCNIVVGYNNEALRNKRRPVQFPLPKKLGSDRLLLVSEALKETPTYKAINPELLRQRQCLKRAAVPPPPPRSNQRRVHFRAVDTFHEFDRYNIEDYPQLFFSFEEFIEIHQRDDVQFDICVQAMKYTKSILQLWGMCSWEVSSTTTKNSTSSNSSSRDTHIENDLCTSLAGELLRNAPIDNARGLEQRIITGIRNHRQKAVKSFLHTYNETKHHQDTKNKKNEPETHYEAAISCPRYLNFSRTAGRFARVLAAGDAVVAKEIHEDDKK